MKILTDKTLSTFERWYYETHCKSSIKFEDLLLWQKSEIFDWLYSQCETIQYAFAVEFFDSVGIYIDTPTYFDKQAKYNRGFECIIFQDKQKEVIELFNDNDVFYSRQEANAKAIEKANEIFNNR